MSDSRFARGAGVSPIAMTSGQAATTSARSNVLFVLTDDMRLDDMQYLPQVQQLIANQGVTFDAYFDNVTLCCPARTSILRGQYSHNTGVLTNGGTNGGFETAHANDVEQSTIATAMRGAGYETGLFGKYLNGYPNTVSPSYIPPGWDSWASASAGNPYNEYNYTLNQNGTAVRYGNQPSDYGTDVYVRQTEAFVAQAAKDGMPFFAYLGVYAPHQPATPAPQDLQAFPALQAPRDPAFNEADVSDKPEFIRRLPLLNQRQIANIDNLYKRRAESLQDVDRKVAELVGVLQQNGQLDNTYIIFTSDNGFHLGQHRMPAGKMTAYETDIHLPLLVRGPGIAPGSHTSAIAGNIDLAPTMAALGGTTMSDSPDGRSLATFLMGGATPADWRQVYLLEHWTDTSSVLDRSSAAQLEPNDPDQGGVAPGDDPAATAAAIQVKGIPEFHGIRTANYTYVEYVTGERELYDINADPEELNNLIASADPSLLSVLHQRVASLSACSVDACRSAENQPVSAGP
jgi:arylsulfatase A-like enzyme